MRHTKNNITLIGRLGTDPVVRRFENGQRLAKMQLATHETKRQLNGRNEKLTRWHQLVAWGNTADIIKQMLRKGRHIAIEGKLNQRSWKGKDGQQRISSEVIVKNFTLLN
ncbi:MAG: single-stranded DNA-binding protein [Bacteroidales bacterium]|jgi:single-strand DNA-binding protein